MTRAAGGLHVTQPTLSKALRALEDELGKRLFTRHSFSISLTEEGALLRDRAEDLLLMVDKIEQEFLSLDEITGGDLYLGLAESYQIRYLAREIKRLKDRYPDLRYHITSGDTEQVTEGLDKGLLDFAVLCGLPNERKYEHLLFPEADYFGLVMRKDDCLAGREGIRVGDLVGLPLFCSKQSWRAISARGQRRDSGSSASRAPFDLPITAQCSSRRAWGTSWRSTGWSTPHRKAGSCSDRFHRRWRFRSAWPGAGARPSLLSQSAFWISCEVCLPRAGERTILRPEQEAALYDRTGPAAGIRVLMGRSSSTLATAARWGASWLCA